jgi:hypothetical protein
MRKYVWTALALALIVAAVFSAAPYSQASAVEPKILQFDTMAGLPQAFTGAQNPIRGVNGGGLPWAIGASRGELYASGKLVVKVQGLVFSAGPNAGSNTVPNFRAIVSCLKSDGSVENVTTGLFPATLGPAAQGGGTAKIEANLTLPQPCIAPIVFVTSPGGAWFAATGQ